MKQSPTIKLTDLHLNDGSHGLPKNPRFIRDARFKKLCDSIRDFPEAMKARGIVVDEQGVILGGNMRWRACRELGMKEIPAAWVHRLTGLTVEQKRRFVIMDNRGFGEDDMDLLANEWDIDELIGAGFDEEELTGLIDKDEAQDAEAQVDKAEELNKVWKVKTGDLWQIGEHRLACGDSTKAEDVDRVMGGEKADLCLTDPPYGIGEAYATVADSTENLDKLLPLVFPVIKKIATVTLLTPGNKNQWKYPRPDWILAWFVTAGTGCNPWGFTCWNAIYAYGKDPYLSAGLGSRPDAFVKTEASEKNGHPTPKPIGVWNWLLERGSIKRGDVIFDPFLGSGTTMVACQNLDRKCRGIEISPAYCAVILQRMTDAFPGIKIERAK